MSTKLVTPNGAAADGHAPTYEGGAADKNQVRQKESLTIESTDGHLTSSKTKLDEKQLSKFLDVNLDTQERRDFKRQAVWKSSSVSGAQSILGENAPVSEPVLAESNGDIPGRPRYRREMT